MSEIPRQAEYNVKGKSSGIAVSSSGQTGLIYP
jgi:hypothetical protein